MKLLAYPEYKDSGIEWLNSIPVHWRTRALRWMSKRYAGGTPDRGNESFWEQGTIPWINSGAVNQGLITEPSALITREGFTNSSAKWIPNGALVMALAGQGKTKGMVAQVGIETTCNQSMAAIVPHHEVNARFLLWWLTMEYERLRNLAGGEQRDGLNLEILGALPIPVLPHDEQGAIADFLDRETAKIGALVAKKRTLIERLHEKRTALISRTVTRGLPPDVARAAGLEPSPRMKPSGIDWLGDVPEHWDVKKLKYVAQIESGHTPSRSVEEYWADCTIPWVSLNDSGFLRSNDRIADTQYQISELGMANSSAHLLPTNTVVLSRDATVGLCAITTRPMAVSQHFMGYICGPELLAQFLLQTFKVMRQHLECLSSGSTIQTIGLDHVRALKGAVPPIAEQQEIVDFLDRETHKLDAMIEKVEQAIGRLQEYRAAIITAAVTGKVDVREAAA